jgi:hypothetical protein
VDLLARWQIDHGSGGYPASLKPARHPPEWWPGMHRNPGPAWSGTVARHQPEYALNEFIEAELTQEIVEAPGKSRDPGIVGTLNEIFHSVLRECGADSQLYRA